MLRQRAILLLPSLFYLCFLKASSALPTDLTGRHMTSGVLEPHMRARSVNTEINGLKALANSDYDILAMLIELDSTLPALFPLLP